MTDAIVVASILLAVAFFGGWLLRPDLRAWIERPKHRFLADVQNYEKRNKSDGPGSKQN